MTKRSLGPDAAPRARKRSSPAFFETPARFRAWLAKNHASANELVVGFYKVASGKRSITWPQSVDEALCFGWIDGIRKGIDENSYQIRFSPRRTTSVWSAVNVAKMKGLIAAGKVSAAGLAAYQARSDKKTGIYSFEQQQPLKLQAAETRKIRTNAKAWRYFEALPPGYRRAITYWVVSAKQPATRARRLAALIDACAEGRRLLK